MYCRPQVQVNIQMTNELPQSVLVFIGWVIPVLWLVLKAGMFNTTTTLTSRVMALETTYGQGGWDYVMLWFLGSKFAGCKGIFESFLLV